MKDITQTIEESKEASEAINPNGTKRVWHVEGPDGNGVHTERQYTQEELSFFNKQDFVTLINGYVDRFISGELGISLKDLFSGDMRAKVQIPTEFTPEQAESMVSENAEVIEAVIKAINQIPGLQKDIMVLALGVPGGEAPWFKETIGGPVYRGGLTDEHGFDILKTFITQNAKPLQDFFVEKGRDLVDHFRVEVLGQDLSTETTSPSTDGGTPSSTTAPSPAEIP